METGVGREGGVGWGLGGWGGGGGGKGGVEAGRGVGGGDLQRDVDQSLSALLVNGEV